VRGTVCERDSLGGRLLSVREATVREGDSLRGRLLSMRGTVWEGGYCL